MPALDPISEIHRAIEPLLRPYFERGIWVIEPVPFPMSLDEFKRLMRATPWIGIAWREFAVDTNAGRSLMGQHQLALTIVAKNAAGLDGRFFGDRLSPGLYPSLVTAAAVLHGKTLPDIGTLNVTRAGQSYAEGYGDLGAVVGLIELSVRTKFGDVLGAVEAAPDFARLVSSFELQPPADGREPVTDTIDLPGASAP
ncbi:hypothetical protein Xaut_4492 [Xanthobacter versatilis]|uniref:DUF1834 family protein n=1 Tax=Xanthobacter autotrophicus (strain ATCC BAA-1158 / Py2) TaxID=78245 RepID=A7INW7_XANP2|nr:hypothetical protein Xaut_4492 [Xanthobacter autotrophicus Py2]